MYNSHSCASPCNSAIRATMITPRRQSSASTWKRADRRVHTSVTSERQTETSAPQRTSRKASLLDSRCLAPSPTPRSSSPLAPLSSALSRRTTRAIPLLSRSRFNLSPPAFSPHLPDCPRRSFSTLETVHATLPSPSFFFLHPPPPPSCSFPLCSFLADTCSMGPVAIRPRSLVR